MARDGARIVDVERECSGPLTIGHQKVPACKIAGNDRSPGEGPPGTAIRCQGRLFPACITELRPPASGRVAWRGRGKDDITPEASGYHLSGIEVELKPVEKHHFLTSRRERTSVAGCPLSQIAPVPRPARAVRPFAMQCVLRSPADTRSFARFPWSVLHEHKAASLAAQNGRQCVEFTKTTGARECECRPG